MYVVEPRAQQSTAQHSTAQQSTAQHSAAEHSTAQAQHSAAEHSTAQHSAIPPAQSSKATTCRSDQSTYKKMYVCTCMLRPVYFPGAWSSWHFQLAGLRLKCGTIYFTTRYINTRYVCHSNACFFVSERSEAVQVYSNSSTAAVVCASKVCTYYMHAASGLFSWSMELLAFASRLFAPKMLDHLPTTSVPFQSLLAGERSGRNRPLREAPRTYDTYYIRVEHLWQIFFLNRVFAIKIIQPIIPSNLKKAKFIRASL